MSRQLVLMFVLLFLRLLGKEVPRFRPSKQYCSQETRGGGGGSLFRSVCDPEVLQAVDNEKISTLITSYKAAETSFNNPMGAHHCHCQTALSAPLCFPSSAKTIITEKVKSRKYFPKDA